ncbi:MAG: hypothetical protein GWN84_05665 [Gammaproteobacteria bacterium]|nr:hypothetical protein [Gammaproteobacteria bacterium]NIR82465.1 hypothetical protein [Gammaproteobacteria bacterium]NIR88461.1 hypothetical protein [Gammaproteobacteria bacterium]NIU03601.1 hypothetical protein [Gammaproteobacteria bacterium]NIV50953.1 hypothetical protein [Gammaproteobacteria bacterium]
MANVLESLRNDHENMRVLLDILESQMAVFGGGEYPNVLLIEDILDYLRGYPTLCHHPMEDLVYDKLHTRVSSDVLERIGDLQAEHEELARLTSELAAGVDNVLPDPKAPRSRFVALAKEFLDRYRRHMELEETVLFPAAAKHLSENDWAAIDRELARHRDPLFGKRLEERFANLHHAIMVVARGPH